MILILFSIVAFSYSCSLNGYNGGYCVASETVRDSIQFCRDYLKEYICVPQERVIYIPCFNKELWPKHSIVARDDLLRS